MLIFDSSSIVLNLMDYSNVFFKSSIKVDFVKKTTIFISYFISYYHILYIIYQISWLKYSIDELLITNIINNDINIYIFV